MVDTNTFKTDVLQYISMEYGDLMLSQVKSPQNETVVANILGLSQRQQNDIVHTANKIIAMLRLNPSNP
jgi:hypothetical protein